MTDGHENEAQSPCKNLQGRPICSPKNLDFSRLRNQIRMRSLVPRERNYELLLRSLRSLRSNHLRFDFHGLVRLLQGLRLHFLPSSTACRKILLDFFYFLCFKFCSAFTFCLLVVCLCLNFLAFLNSFLLVQCCKLRCLLDCLG